MPVLSLTERTPASLTVTCSGLDASHSRTRYVTWTYNIYQDVSKQQITMTVAPGTTEFSTEFAPLKSDTLYEIRCDIYDTPEFDSQLLWSDRNSWRTGRLICTFTHSYSADDRLLTVTCDGLPVEYGGRQYDWELYRAGADGTTEQLIASTTSVQAVGATQTTAYFQRILSEGYWYIVKIRQDTFGIALQTSFQYGYNLSFSLTYDANGGDNAPGTVYRSEGSLEDQTTIPVTLSANIPTLNGYTFAGWMLSYTPYHGETTVVGLVYPGNTYDLIALPEPNPLQKGNEYVAVAQWATGTGCFTYLHYDDDANAEMLEIRILNTGSLYTPCLHMPTYDSTQYEPSRIELYDTVTEVTTDVTTGDFLIPDHYIRLDYYLRRLTNAYIFAAKIVDGQTVLRWWPATPYIYKGGTDGWVRARACIFHDGAWSG